MRNRNIIPGRMFISNHGMGRVAPITAPDSSPGDGQCRLGQNTGIRIVKRKRNHRIKTSAPASQHRPESEERCSLWSIERQRCRSCFSPFFFFFHFFKGGRRYFSSVLKDHLKKQPLTLRSQLIFLTLSHVRKSAVISKLAVPCETAKFRR